MITLSLITIALLCLACAVGCVSWGIYSTFIEDHAMERRGYGWSVAFLAAAMIWLVLSLLALLWGF